MSIRDRRVVPCQAATVGLLGIDFGRLILSRAFALEIGTPASLSDMNHIPESEPDGLAIQRLVCTVRAGSARSNIDAWRSMRRRSVRLAGITSILEVDRARQPKRL